MINHKTKNGVLVFVTAISTLICSMAVSAASSKQANNMTSNPPSATVSGLNDPAIGGTTKSSLIGAGVGALSSAGARTYMDNAENELRAQVQLQPQLNGVKVVRDKEKIHLFFPADASFDKNSTALNADFSRMLDSITSIIKKYNSTVIHITGNAEPSETNQNALGLRRADTVSAYLQHKGIPYERLQTSSNGARNPIASNDKEKDRKLNRRVDITLIAFTK